MVYQWRKVLDDFQKENNLTDSLILMPQTYVNASLLRKYYQSEDGNRQGSQLPFNYLFIEYLNETSTADDFKTIIDYRLENVPKGKHLTWLLGNHDQHRFTDRYGKEKADGLLALIMTLPGVPNLYNVRIQLLI